MKKHLTLLVFATLALTQAGLMPCLAAGLGDELFKFTASDAAANDQFGSSVAVSGNTAIVGAPNDNNIGSAYLFDVTTGQQLRKLTTSDVDEFDLFGASVAIIDNKALVGALWLWLRIRLPVRRDDGQRAFQARRLRHRAR